MLCNKEMIKIKKKIEDTKGVIRNRKLKRDRLNNDQRKMTNNVLQNITQKTKDRLKKAVVNPCTPDGLAFPVPPVTPVVLLLTFSYIEIVLDTESVCIKHLNLSIP